MDTSRYGETRSLKTDDTSSLPARSVRSVRSLLTIEILASESKGKLKGLRVHRQTHDYP